MRSAALFLIGLSAAAVSCDRTQIMDRQGTLSWNYSSSMQTRSLADMPDTDAFILQIIDENGNILYDGDYGDSPESLLVDPGSYTVKVMSREFDRPEFSAPQYGDEQIVVVQDGASARVSLDCSQMNAGVRLKTSDDFRTTYPDGSLTVSSEDGELVYVQGENRIGYFNPGSIVVSLDDGTAETKLVTRYVSACEILSLGISCSGENPDDPGQSSTFSIQLDTARYWNNESYVIGSGVGAEPGSSMASAYGAPQVKDHPGATDVWVCGYIVGGDLTSSSKGVSFTPPFKSRTNIAIAARSSATDKSSCVSVKLGSGEIRELLNLVDNPDNLGCKVYLKGDIVDAYYGIPGIESLTEFALRK